MSQVAIEISERKPNEKSKKIRRNGQVPCIIYGEFLDKPVSVKLEYPKLIRLLSSNSKGSIIPLTLNSETKNCVIKDVQKDMVTGKVIHVDFQAVNKNEVIKMKIPVSFIGLENLQLKRLVLETFLTEIEMQGPVEKIPEYIKLDVSKMNFEDKIFVKNITLPEEVRLLTDPNALVSVVNGSMNSKSNTDDEE